MGVKGERMEDTIMWERVEGVDQGGRSALIYFFLLFCSFFLFYEHEVQREVNFEEWRNEEGARKVGFPLAGKQTLAAETELF